MAYTKNSWKSGDVVTSSKLNHMEDGIADAGDVFIVGGVIFGNSDSPEGTMDKTWKEIHDALQTKIGIVVIKANDGVTVAQASIQGVNYNTDLTKYAVTFMAFGQTVDFYADTESGYPTYVSV